MYCFTCSSQLCFAPCTWCKGIQDSFGLWIPRLGFRIPITGFQIFWRIPQIPIVSSIRDSYSCIPDSTSKTFQDCGFHMRKSTAFRNPLHGKICFKYERAFATRALATRATSQLKYSRLQIFELNRDCSQSRLVKCFVIFPVFHFNSKKRITAVNQNSRLGT